MNLRNIMSEIDFEALFQQALSDHPVKPIEYRVYYGDDGEILTYTCDDLPGNFLVIDAEVFAQGRYDLTVLDGKLVSKNSFDSYYKMVPGDHGTPVCATNMMLIDPDSELYWHEKQIFIM